MDNGVAAAKAPGAASRREIRYSLIVFACGLLSVVFTVGVVFILVDARAPFADARADAVVTFFLWLIPLVPVGFAWFVCDRLLPGDPDTFMRGRPLLAKIGFLLTVPVLALAGNAAIVAFFTIIFGAGNYWD